MTRWRSLLILAVQAAAFGQPVWENFDKSIVQILDQERSPAGTGFVFGTSGDAVYILTARHVVDPIGPGALIRFYENQAFTYSVDAGPRSDNDVDLAVLVVKSTPGKPVPTNFVRFSVGNVSRLAVGTPVTTIGHPLGESWLPAINNEIQLDRIGTDLRKFGFKSISIDNGSSGGPIFLSDGSLVGIVQAHNELYAVGFRVDQIYAILHQIWHLPVNYLQVEPDKDLVSGKAQYDSKRYAQALPLFQAAAGRGDPEAMGYLCEMFRLGQGAAVNLQGALPWCQKAAAADDLRGIVGYARLYDSGIAVSQNGAAEAVRWFSKAADAGSPEGMAGLADHLDEGNGIAKDPARAYSLFKQAADAGSAFAMNAVGVRLNRGTVVPKDDIAALEYFRKAEKGGYAHASANIGIWYESGLGGLREDHSLAFQYYKTAADANDSFGMYRLSHAYKDGIGVRKSDSLAVEWLKKAADAGNVEAMVALAHRFKNGDGVAKDAGLAFSYLKKAAETGGERARDAMYELSMAYRNGEGTAVDTAAADRWRAKAADAGQPAASNEVANTTSDPAAQAKYYLQAAQGGYADAMVQAGFRLWGGTGIAQDYVKAAQWFQKAAEKGNAIGMFDYGLALETGDGVPKADHAAACEWYKKSALKSFAKGRVSYGDCIVDIDPRGALVQYRQAATANEPGAKEKADALEAKLNVPPPVPPGTAAGLNPANPGATNTTIRIPSVPPAVGKGSGAEIPIYILASPLSFKPSVFLDGVELARIRTWGWFATRTHMGDHEFCMDHRGENCKTLSFTENRVYWLKVSEVKTLHYQISIVLPPEKDLDFSVSHPIEASLIKTPRYVFFSRPDWPDGRYPFHLAAQGGAKQFFVQSEFAGHYDVQSGRLMFYLDSGTARIVGTDKLEDRQLGSISVGFCGLDKDGWNTLEPLSKIPLVVTVPETGTLSFSPMKIAVRLPNIPSEKSWACAQVYIADGKSYYPIHDDAGYNKLVVQVATKTPK